MPTSRSVVVLVLVSAAAAGCGGKGGGISAPRTAPVAGTVLVRGKPVAGVRVTFHPKFDMGAVKFTPSGSTDKDGRFTLSTAAPNDGAPPGDYSVTFELPKVSADTGGREVEVDAWKGKHADPAADRWPVTVRSGENQVGPFTLD